MLQIENDFKTARAMITQHSDMLNALHIHTGELTVVTSKFIPQFLVHLGNLKFQVFSSFSPIRTGSLKSLKNK